MKRFYKERDAIVRLWKRNEIGLLDAVKGLVWFAGFNEKDAWNLLENS